MRIRLLIAMAAATSCAVAGTLAMSAFGGTAAEAAPPARHCVQGVAGNSLGCFETYTDAIRAATNGAIDDAPADAAEAVRSAPFRAAVDALASARGSTTTDTPDASGPPDAAGSQLDAGVRLMAQAESAPVIGATLFSGTNYTGNSETIMIAKPCVDDGRYDYTYVPTLVTRSAQSVQPWANCWIWLHEGESTSSTRQGPYKTDTPDLGDWKDRAALIGLS